MYRREYETVETSGVSKVEFWKRNPLGYFVSSMMAGMFVSLGGFLSMTAGGLLGDVLGAKLIVALLFSAALSLVFMAGGERVTGNNLTLSAAAMCGKIRWSETLQLWAFCWVGNFAGSWVTLGLYALSGACTPATAAYFDALAMAKVSLPVGELIIRGVPCNVCVCLAVWCAARMKAETGKLIMSVWCIMIFMVCGFEHSVANMSIVGLALTQGAVTLGQYVCNLFFVTVGNMVGGAFIVSYAYYLCQRK